MVWCEWAEMEIRNNNFPEALKLMHRVTTPPPRKIDYHDEAENVQARVHKSLKVHFLEIKCLSLAYYVTFSRFGHCTRI